MKVPHSNVRKHNTDSIHAHIDAGTGIWFVCTRFIYIFRSSAGAVVVGAGAAFVWVLCVFRLFLTAAARRASTKILVTYMQFGFGFCFDATQAAAQPSIEWTRYCQFQVDRELVEKSVAHVQQFTEIFSGLKLNFLNANEI